MTRLDVALAAAGVALAAVWLVAGVLGDDGTLRLPLAAGVLAVGVALFARASGARDPRVFPAATFAFCGAVGIAEQLDSTPAAVGLVAAALAAIVTAGLRSLRHS